MIFEPSRVILCWIAISFTWFSIMFLSFKYFRFFAAFALCALVFQGFSSVYAQERLKQDAGMQDASSNMYINILPADAVTDNEYPVDIDDPTHPPVRLMPDKSELVRLDEPATTIIAGNPNHLSILPSTSQGLILVGRMPGATHFIALNSKDEIIMQRRVIVAGPRENYVRIRKTCAASEEENCQATQVYYCPDTCHEIALNVEESEEDNSSVEDGGSGGENGEAPNEGEME